MYNVHAPSRIFPKLAFFLGVSQNTFNIAEESAKLRSGAEGAQPLVLPVIEPKKMGARRRDKNSLDINISRLPMPELILRDFQVLDSLMHKLASRLKDYRGVNDAGGIEALCIFYGGKSLFVFALFNDSLCRL
jgi:hypothetical protein